MARNSLGGLPRDISIADMAKQTLIQQSRRKSPAEKAAYHELTGAGRSKVKRPFFGLDRQDEDAILERVERGVEQLLTSA